MKNYFLRALLLLALAGSATAAEQPQPPDQILSAPYLSQLTQHLYRWYLDETDLQNHARKTNITYWIQPLHPTLDPNDRSQLARIILPDFNIAVLLKKADYTIPELDASVSNDTFKITGVTRIPPDTPQPTNATLRTLGYADMKQYLFSIRNQARFPDEPLLRLLGQAVRQQLHNDARENNTPLPSGEQLVYLSPLSPLANELWVFWESGRLLLHFSSDIDLTNQDLWDIDHLTLEDYDIDEQVVVSLDEAPGSNAYLTRDQVGRALYNCIILGRRLVIPPQPLSE
jgi:hypothetical protein